jgi:hypothetical protein
LNKPIQDFGEILMCEGVLIDVTGLQLYDWKCNSSHIYQNMRSNGGLFHGWNSMQLKSWSINHKTETERFDMFIDSRLCGRRKVIEDKKSSLFNCDRQKGSNAPHMGCYKSVNKVQLYLREFRA